MHTYDSIASILVLPVLSGIAISHAAFLLAICHFNLIFHHMLFLHSFPFTSLHIQLHILSSPQPQPSCPDNSCFCLCSPSSSKRLGNLETEKAVILKTPILPPIHHTFV